MHGVAGVRGKRADVNLAKYISDRPLCALRARGFDGEGFFQTSTRLLARTYHISDV
jgi:hypothetical protein